MSNFLAPHGLQHSRPPFPSSTPRVYSNSSPLSWWCHPTISSSVIPFSSRLQSFPASGSFQMTVIFIRWPKYWNFSFSFSSSNEYSGLISFRMDWLDLLEVQGTLKNLLQHHRSKPSILQQISSTNFFNKISTKFLQQISEFDNKEFMIWATVSSQFCFCWLYWDSLSLVEKNIIILISVLK